MSHLPIPGRQIIDAGLLGSDLRNMLVQLKSRITTATGVGPPQHAGSTEVQDNKCGLHIAYRHHFPPEIDEFIGRNFPRIAGHANLVCVRMINARHGMMLLVKAVISPMELAL
jgi:hypothetical protein